MQPATCALRAAARKSILHSSSSPLLLLGRGCVLSAQPLATRSFSWTTFQRGDQPKPTPTDAPTPRPVDPNADPLKTPTAVSTVPTRVRGDWVLFHPVYTADELKAVEVIHRPPQTISDNVSRGLVSFARKVFDFVVRYKHKPMPENWKEWSIEKLREEKFILTEKEWLMRILFLETIAGVPGMVAGTIRHLQSLRLMRRDNGWIHTCLEEAENERMHLMTFMTLQKPSPLFRLIILGAQGVFYNLFFLSYLFSPRTCHRFVGYLEEEAVLTYTRCIKDIENGLFPEWASKPAPEIGIDYWRLSPNATMLDLVYAVRSDETTHRFVNHSLANLDPRTDVNPFALREPDMHTKGKQIEFKRDEAEEYLRESTQLLHKND